MRHVIKWELSQRKTAILWWTIGAVAIAALILLIYPPLKHQADQFNKVINQLPNGLRQLKAGGTGHVDVANPVDFLNSQLYYVTLPILLIILTITRGSSLIGRDERDHTLELLLARPVSRSKLLAAKAFAGTLETFFVTAVTTLAIVVLAKVVGLNIGFWRLVVAGLYTWLFCLSFGAIAFALNAFGHLTKRATTAIAVILSFGGYIVTSLGGLNHTLANVAKFTPYHYFDIEKVLRAQHVHGLDIYLIGIFILCTLLAYNGFKNRDIE